MRPEEMKELAQLLQKVPGATGIDYKDVRRLVSLLRDSPEVGSIELKGLFGTGVVITRSGNGAAFPLPVAVSPAPAAVVSAGAGPVTPVPPEAARAVAGPAIKEIKSPMVGTFYASPEPGAEPYVKSGSRIAAGQPVCIIEAMKIMNEIEAEFAGVIREVCVEDAQPVEFGQVLFRVDPNG